MTAAPARTTVVIGGSSGVGRALVELLARRGDRVLAVARDRRDLEALQRDCAVRLGAEIDVEAVDFASVDFDPDAFLARCRQSLGDITHLFMPMGVISSADAGAPSPALIEDLATVNYVRPAQLLSVFCKHFEEKTGHGRALIFSSIATSVPRGKNAAYASAKAALDFYCQALQHHFAGSGIAIQICTLGYVDTAMTFGLKLRLPIASAHAAAAFAIAMSETEARSAHFPRFWALVTAALRMTPWPIRRRLRF